MNPRNTLSLLMRRVLDPLEVRLVKLSPNKIRGIDPLLDLEYLIDHEVDPVIFDVGANDGETAGDFLARFPDATLVAFEPFAPCCDQLRQRFARRPKVEIHNIALGAARTSSRLNTYSGNRMNSLLQLDDRPGAIMSSFKPTGAVDITVDTLDDFCHDHRRDRIDILKVDTQGYDLEVLKGASRLLRSHRIRTLLLEVNFVPMYEKQASFPDLHGFLSSCGYRLVDFYNQLRREGATAWCDACYVAPAVR